MTTTHNVSNVHWTAQHGHGVQQYLAKNILHLIGLPRRQTFVEFGCADGETNSNSYPFEQQLGWRGLCIEPNSQAFEKARKVRKHAINALLTSTPKNFTFAEMSGSCSQTSGIVDFFSPEYHKIMRSCESKGLLRRRVVLPGVTLESLLQQNGMDTVTWISIDCEGCEPDFIRSFNFTRYDVQIVNYEPNTVARRNTSTILAALASHGFEEVQHPGLIDRLFTRGFLRHRLMKQKN